jgi:hypothetical protein
MSKALTVTEAAVKAVEKAQSKALRKARRVIERGLVDATGLNEDGQPVDDDAAQMRGRRLQVARDLRQPVRNMPSYLKLAADRLNMQDKIAAAEKVQAPVSLNIGTVVHVAPPQYEVIDVTATVKEE